MPRAIELIITGFCIKLSYDFSNLRGDSRHEAVQIVVAENRSERKTFYGLAVVNKPVSLSPLKRISTDIELSVGWLSARCLYVCGGITETVRICPVSPSSSKGKVVK